MSSWIEKAKSFVPPALPNDVLDAGEMSFDNVTVHLSSRTLLRDGHPVEIGGRAFDLLCVLLASRGRVVEKDAILKYVWPTSFVDESNLRFQVAALRRVLGAHGELIKTVQGRGYMFADHPGRSTSSAKNQRARERESEGADAATVLVLEDDSETREAICGFLRSAGLQVISFASPEEFRSRPRLPGRKCLILDVWLGQISGLDIQSEIVREHQNLPIIFMSGHADVHTAVRAMKAGALEFFAKPVPHHELLDTVRRSLGAEGQSV